MDKKSHTWPLRYKVLWQSGGREFSREFTYKGWARKFAQRKISGGAKEVRIYDKVDLELHLLSPDYQISWPGENTCNQNPLI